MVTVCWESRAEAAHLLSRIELRRCWVVLATQDQYTLIDFYGHTHTHTHTRTQHTLLIALQTELVSLISKEVIVKLSAGRR